MKMARAAEVLAVYPNENRENGENSENGMGFRGVGYL